MNAEDKSPKRDSLKVSISYVINLSSRPDRRNHALSQISMFGLRSEMIEAISVEDLGAEDFGFLTPPAYACWQSHMKALEYFLASREPFAIVFEDDFQIDNFEALQRSLLKIDLNDFDVIQLGYLVNNLRERLEIFGKNVESIVFQYLGMLINFSRVLNSKYANRLRVKRIYGVPFGFVPDDLRAGAHAYLISRSAAQKIVSNFKMQNILTMDGFLISTNWTRPFRTIRVSRSYISQMKSPSSIR
jgi:GR25 family glycosyltransferase involved in LPS biosynthesis